MKESPLLRRLRKEHADVEAQLNALQAHLFPDPMALAILKKRKLILKDTIQREEMLARNEQNAA